ncbi:TetR/AcrR family transcriptional regulator [Oecophyllibacter saccharovorans]|uniref:TetR/AcrR family transcriptional regulator n=1 Tax=Oecophyllibacter saccharovorans TaxID=2558360 RepID=A0A506UL58_9PROT|nr:TetR/AcrR family transcriptional regulator [Oecophyllibacter saccharovorans]TPW33982.1 TetR/AcrR family transcriptional regulator [Oecophyllibacter saccharovorans]
MARPRSFDEQEVLLKALDVFRNKGFRGTSLTDLLAATELSKSSLYDCFGNKKQLFLKAFALYRQARLNFLQSHLENAPHIRAGVEGFFQALLAAPAEGCLSCSEPAVVSHDKEMGEILATDQAELEDFLTKELTAGQQLGNISSAMSARALAHSLMVLYQGLQHMARAGTPAQYLQEAVTGVLTILDPVGGPEKNCKSDGRLQSQREKPAARTPSHRIKRSQNKRVLD